MEVKKLKDHDKESFGYLLGPTYNTNCERVNEGEEKQSENRKGINDQKS